MDIHRLAEVDLNPRLVIVGSWQPTAARFTTGFQRRVGRAVRRGRDRTARNYSSFNAKWFRNWFCFRLSHFREISSVLQLASSIFIRSVTILGGERLQMRLSDKREQQYK
jgi:hypothetical protein